jgi:hypothetical protein
LRFLSSKSKQAVSGERETSRTSSDFDFQLRPLPAALRLFEAGDVETMLLMRPSALLPSPFTPCSSRPPRRFARFQHVAPSSPPPDVARSASNGEKTAASPAGCSPEPERRRLLRPPGATGAFDVYSRRGGAYSTAATEATPSKRARELPQKQLIFLERNRLFLL